MNADAKCPACGGEAITPGSLVASDKGERFNGRFFPTGLKFFAMRRSVEVAKLPGFQACATCGCLWNQVDPAKLREVLENRRPGGATLASRVPHRAKRWIAVLLALLAFGVAAGALSMLSPS